MRTLLSVIFTLLAASFILSGCSRTIDGPRFWWDDRNQERLDDDYRLPDDPAVHSDTEDARRSSPSGEDLSGDSLRDYRDNLEHKEERRRSESSLLDF
ncbi:MAG: hypothetical protein FWG74_09840 [Planctomycetes bacterium]|nr:hypothetical protein [Planctomycetota bacterium]